ncbi:hypothetical protein FACS1894201_08340 [Bacteroidia bacterium]|nr:hypothetical protein FACS1894201_08340 [Bacteroidia bacterium]
MIVFPKHTEVNRFVAKTKFYERAGLTEKQKTAFQTEIERISWTHKFSPDTLNIKAGKRTPEMEVFEIRLKGQDITESTLKIIDSAIPYPILFILTAKGGLQKAVMAYKTIKNEELKIKRTKEDKILVDKYFSTEWLSALELAIKGNDANQVFENFLRQIAPELGALDGSADIDADIEKYKNSEYIERQISMLESKLRTEPQFNKQLEIADKIKKLKNRV